MATELKNYYSTPLKDKSGAFFTIGHPILDISTDVSLEFLDKYDLNKNDMILCDPNKHASLYKEIIDEEKFKKTLIPGGSSMNTARTIQWALNNDKTASKASFYTGTIGNDVFAHRLKAVVDVEDFNYHFFQVHDIVNEKNYIKHEFSNPFIGSTTYAEKVKLKPLKFPLVHVQSSKYSKKIKTDVVKYSNDYKDQNNNEIMIDLRYIDRSVLKDVTGKNIEQLNCDKKVSAKSLFGNFQTGTCAVLINEKGLNRSMVTNLGACKIYGDNFIDKLWKNHVKKASYFYITGYFLNNGNGGLSVLKKIGDYCNKSGKTFIYNISAPFVPHVFKKQLNQVLEYTDVLFGNESEYLAWAEANSEKIPKDRRKDLEYIGQVVANMPKLNSKKPRLCVITQGHQPTIICQKQQIIKVPVPKMSKSEIVDTNAAGDAYVAGFACGLLYNKSIEECAKCGHSVAREILKMAGCTFPKKNVLKFC